MANENSLVSRGDLFIENYGTQLLRWRWLVISLFLITVLVTSSGARFLQIRGDYRYNFGDNNPQLNAFEEIQDIYAKNDQVLFALMPKDGNVFTPRTLSAVHKLTESAWQLPYSSRVDSISNFQHSYARNDELIVENLIEDPTQLDIKRLVEIQQVVLAEPLLKGRLISPDSSATGINITIQLPDDTGSHEVEVIEKAETLLAELEAQYPDITFALTGGVALSSAINRLAEWDFKTLTPLMYLVLLVMMIFFLRSVWATLGTILITGASAASAIGVAGWLEIPMTPQASMAPTVILTVAIADGIHISVSLAQSMQKGLNKRTAIIESLRLNMGPVFLTSLTTGIGFLSLNFGDSPPFSDLGNITTIGVAFAWLYSVSALPAFMAVSPYKAPRTNRGLSMSALADFLVRRRKRVLFLSATLTFFAAASIPRIELNDMFLDFIEPSVRFRSDTDLVRENLTGIYLHDYSVSSGKAEGISDPEYLRYIDDFAIWLREQPEVLHVSVLSDIMRRLNKNMNFDQMEAYVLPKRADLSAQYLLLYEMSLPYGLDLNNTINIDKSSTKIGVTFNDLSAKELRNLDSKALVWLTENKPNSDPPFGAGTAMMFAHLSERNISGMIKGTGIAFALISLTLMLALQSFRLGILSLIPNLVPTVIAFGIWSLLVGKVGFTVSMVTACSLGLIVDATVHFLSKYRRALKTDGATVESSIRYALETVGNALWIVFLILVVGFSVLTISPFQPNTVMGQLIAITIGSAIIADFFLLPTLLLTLGQSDSPTRHIPEGTSQDSIP